MSLVTTVFTANPGTLNANLANANDELAHSSAQEIITWALARSDKPVISTNFRPGSAALLHMVVRARPGIPVIWVDTGYNTAATYRHVEALRVRWDLNLHCYTPRMTPARLAAVAGGIPAVETTEFAHFVHAAKLEPFERAFNELQPDLWFTGIRREQTAYRENLGVVSRGTHNTLRVAPLYRWQDDAISAYLATHAITDNEDYLDPTKPDTRLECGLQLLA